MTCPSCHSWSFLEESGGFTWCRWCGSRWKPPVAVVEVCDRWPGVRRRLDLEREFEVDFAELFPQEGR